MTKHTRCVALDQRIEALWRNSSSSAVMYRYDTAKKDRMIDRFFVSS
jgi:hypothetical protein